MAYWEAANRNAEVRHSINTRITYESVFRYYSRELAKSGITNVKKFRAVLHAAQSRACEERKRNLEAKHEAERKAVGRSPRDRRRQPPPKRGMIQRSDYH